MILSYSMPRFEILIKAGIKIHTIREDKTNRWKPEMKIHHWMHNPRNVSKNPFQFTHPGTDILISKQEITIEPSYKLVIIDGKPLRPSEIDTLAHNDGLQNELVFFNWFTTSYQGYILHFTDHKY